MNVDGLRPLPIKLFIGIKTSRLGFNSAQDDKFFIAFYASQNYETKNSGSRVCVHNMSLSQYFLSVI